MTNASALSEKKPPLEYDTVLKCQPITTLLYISFRPGCDDLEKLHQYSVMLLHHSLDSFFTDCHLEDEKDTGGFQNLVRTSIYDRLIPPAPLTTDWHRVDRICPNLVRISPPCPQTSWHTRRSKKARIQALHFGCWTQIHLFCN